MFIPYLGECPWPMPGIQPSQGTALPKLTFPAPHSFLTQRKGAALPPPSVSFLPAGPYHPTWVLLDWDWHPQGQAGGHREASNEKGFGNSEQGI